MYYLRDRDFDYEPLEGPLKPIIDRLDHDSKKTLGWRWSRHEIENYMLEPLVVVRVAGASQDEFETALVEAGSRIRYYEAARWAIGKARRSLPPNHELRTRPPELNSLQLPADLSEVAASKSIVDHVSEFRDHLGPALSDEALGGDFDNYNKRFADPAFQNASDVLLWFSGKDIAAALAPWLATRGFSSPGEFRARVRDWMISHSEDVLAILPEWRALVEALNKE